MKQGELKSILDQAVEQYNQPHFIPNDPICIPHRFDKLQDIEIMGFWTAILAWGQRKTIINKALELAALMGNQPHDFILNHSEEDRIPFLNFKHRTFQATDCLYFLEFFQHYYRHNHSLENAFSRFLSTGDEHIGPALIGFQDLFFSLPDAPKRTRKHISSPARKSTCKRLNMFLRWMVRQDNNGVDFGLWRQIAPHQLLMPLDVHVDRVARRLGLIERKQTDWLSVLELTARLKKFDPQDPTRYDFALFEMGVLENK
jgi:uncharacterized protein (TIGR02757 family)